MYPGKNTSNSQTASLSGVLFNNRRFMPWYDDRADYNTDAKSYYDYLARNNKILDAIVFTLNKLLRYKFNDTKSIDFELSEVDDNTLIESNLIISKLPELKTLQTEYPETFTINNGLELKDDGVWSPDYLPLFSKIFEKIGNINNKNSFGSLSRLGSKYFDQNTEASNAQGMAALNGNVIVQYYQYIGAGLDRNKGVLRKLNIETGKELITNEIVGYHGNSMTYNVNDKKLYLTESYGAGSSRILKINSDTLNVEDTIDLSDTMTVKQVHSIGYDELDNIYIVADNNIMDFYSSDWKLLYSIKWSDIYNYEPTYMQGVQVNGNTLYWLGGHKGEIFTYKIDVANKKLDFLTTYIFNEFQENIYPLSEIEALGFNNKNGKIYVSSHVSNSNYTGLTEYFETNSNFISEMTQQSDILQNNTTSLLQSNIYVSNNNNYKTDGSLNNPFNNLLEAQNVLLSPYIKYPNLVILDDFKNDVLSITNITNATITTNGKSVKALNIVNSSNIYVASAIIDGFTSWRDTQLFIYNSNVRINSLKMNNTNNIDNDNVKIERSNVYLSMNKNSYKINIVNSVLTTDTPMINFVKDSKSSKLYGYKKLNENEITKIDTTGIEFFNKFKALINFKINEKTLPVKINGIIDSNVINISEIVYNDKIYLVKMHYDITNKDNSYLKLYNISDNADVNYTSETVTMYLGD